MSENLTCPVSLKNVSLQIYAVNFILLPYIEFLLEAISNMVRYSVALLEEATALTAFLRTPIWYTSNTIDINLSRIHS